MFIKHQEYFKTGWMIKNEEWARSQDFFEDVRVVSMAANIVDGHLIIGNRHFCPIMHMQIDLLGLNSRKHNISTDQGFVDQWGIYMSRQEAWNVAKKQGQIKEVFEEGVLYSECYL